jgi:hypothetical protein
MATVRLTLTLPGRACGLVLPDEDNRLAPLPVALGDVSGGKGGFPNETLLRRDNGGLGFNTPRPLLRRGSGGGVGLSTVPAPPPSGFGAALGLKLLRRDTGGLGLSNGAIPLLRRGSVGGDGDGDGDGTSSAPATCEGERGGLGLRRGLGPLRSRPAFWSRPTTMPRDDKRRSSGDGGVVAFAAENDPAGDKDGGDAWAEAAPVA